MGKLIAILGALGMGVLAFPLIALLAAAGTMGSALACIETSAGGPLSASAPVPVQARGWVAAAKTACPDLPEAWIAAVMMQESAFNPEAYADDSNGGTWGLFQMNNSIWTNAYGHPWSADLNDNGTWDVKEGDIAAATGGKYLCSRLEGVRKIRVAHPDWASSAIPVLDALIIAHNAGESRLETYPAIPDVTKKFITTVNFRVTQWSDDAEPGAQPEVTTDPDQGSTPSPTATQEAYSLADDVGWTTPGTEPTAPTDPASSSPATGAPVYGLGCMPTLGTTGQVAVPPGTPNDVEQAVRTAMSYVGVTSGWHQLCARLACRAYGYESAGYVSAKAEWDAMVAVGNARQGDVCPPLGSFVYWNTGRPYGHVSMVVQADPGCDPAKIMVTANGIFDSATGNHGGVYLVSFAQINAGYLHGAGYLGWSDPLCKGAVLAAGTVHPAPSGM
ncbi:Transglycosylase SLT domain-containing protein [Sanguibacter gelidistatuariae]|uniref:Transglycosylase SLT domain-containing protein n=1 Tax=Sanguibacter gelidistatuariae TaxID=1814289 RepID=A0A1G6T1T0_9MICO|nr:transglycosylase SLT domain-containing protein [Sanguibacter gelidistatuariae]SDD22345.1 Transglycosylase SLT domain-containing protein [Sanguibacter gelidistatuariae]